jgi:hypothetical protein
MFFLDRISFLESKFMWDGWAMASTKKKKLGILAL